MDRESGATAIKVPHKVPSAGHRARERYKMARAGPLGQTNVLGFLQLKEEEGLRLLRRKS